MQKLFLGIDGGGTKTDVLCTDEHLHEFGHGSSGPTNLTSTTIGAASFNLKEAVRQALEDAPADHEVVAAVMGLAGMDSEREHEVAYKTFMDILRPFGITTFTLVNDSMIALENGTDNQNALIVISGTGSICVGRNAAGQTAKTGGMDFLLTDQGSGYDIGRHILREAVKSFDGRRHKTILEDLVCKHFTISDISYLKNEVYNPLLSKIEVAELSQLCSVAYEAGDEAAKDIFAWIERELLVMVETVIRRLELEHAPTDIVFSGSILKIDHVQQAIKQQLIADFPELSFVSPEKPPVYGALKMAFKK
jgi:N-acetylglucosamine kinase-like BadF-type ATPase